MKTIKLFLFILLAFFVTSVASVSANEVTGTVTVIIAPPSGITPPIVTAGLTNYGTTTGIFSVSVAAGTNPATIISRGLCLYSTSTTTPSAASCIAQGGTTTGTFSVTRNSLTPGTLYYYRGYADNTATSRGYSSEGSFTTALTPTIADPTATNVTSTGATLNATVTSRGIPNTITSEGFYYHTDPSVGQGSTQVIHSPLTDTFSNIISGLTPSTTYYFYAYVNNGKVQKSSTIRSFTTPVTPILPVVTSPTATSITSNSAVLGATVSVIGNPAATSRGVCWKKASLSPNTAVYQGISSNNADSGCLVVPAAVNLSPYILSTGNLLTPNTLYNFRGYIYVNSTTPYYTTNGTFTTLAAPIMTGTLTLSSSSCTIPLNGTSCNVNLSWTVTNPTGATTQITASGMTNYTSPSVSSGGPTAFTVPYSSRLFHLYNNAVDLAQVTATSSCVAGTSWDGSKCTGVNMTGIITPASPTCNLSVGSSSCTVNLSWTVTNPTGATTQITASGMTNYTSPSVSSGGPTSFTIPYPTRTFFLYNNGIELYDVTATAVPSGCVWNGSTCVATSYTVTPSAGANGSISPNTPQIVNYNTTRSFTVTPSSGYTASVGGTCPYGSLVGNTYTTGPIVSSCTVVASFTQMSGTLAPSQTCTIPLNGTSCSNVTLSWTTTNPVLTSGVTNNGSATPSSPSGNNSSATFTVPYKASGVDFYLYNNSIQLALATVTTSCAAGTTWTGSCTTIPSAVAPTVTTTDVNPSSIFSTSADLGGNVTNNGGSAVISRGIVWSTTSNPGLSDNPTPIGAGNGSFISTFTIFAPNTTYYFKAYATNSAGTSLGSQKSFTTQALPSPSTITNFWETNSKTKIDLGQSVSLNWVSQNATYCSLTSTPSAFVSQPSLPANSGGAPFVHSPAKTVTYYLVCTGAGGPSATSSLSIQVGNINPTYIEQ